MAFFYGTIGILIIWVLFFARFEPTVPECPEDAIYVGGGDYREGHWDYLYCWDAD